MTNAATCKVVFSNSNAGGSLLIRTGKLLRVGLYQMDPATGVHLRRVRLIRRPSFCFLHGRWEPVYV